MTDVNIDTVRELAANRLNDRVLRRDVPPASDMNADATYAVVGSRDATVDFVPASVQQPPFSLREPMPEFFWSLYSPPHVELRSVTLLCEPYEEEHFFGNNLLLNKNNRRMIIRHVKENFLGQVLPHMHTLAFAAPNVKVYFEYSDDP